MPAAAVAAGCAPSTFEGGFASGAPAPRVAAIEQVRRSRDRSQIPQVVECLGSEDTLVRVEAIRCLKDLTGQTFGYDPDASPLEREPALRRWETWCREEGLAPAPAPQEFTPA